MSGSEQLHRPKGTPDGGQFAGTAHPEAAGIELDGAGPARSTWEELTAAYSARDKTTGDIERLSARELADSIHSRFPTAATLHLEDSDQGSHFAATRITDAQGYLLHRIGDESGSADEEDDLDIDILASNFNNDAVSHLLTNHGTRRAPDYRLDLTVHGTPSTPTDSLGALRNTAFTTQAHEQIEQFYQERGPLNGLTMSRSDAVPMMTEHLDSFGNADRQTAESAARPPLPYVPLADVQQGTPVYADHPEVQAGAVRDVILSGGTWFSRRRDHIYPSEPSVMRFQTNRPISDDEMHQMASVIVYAYTSKVRGESMGDPLRDSPYSFIIDADTSKTRREDLSQALQEFEDQLPAMVLNGSPVRTTDRNGPAGTRLVLGLNDPGLTFETYYDSVHESSE